MAALVDKYFSQADFDAIEAAVKKAESRTSGEIAVELASRSRNWGTERLVHALVFSLFCVLLALLLTRDINWGVYYNTTQALFWGGIGFVAAYFGWGRFLNRKERRRRAVWDESQSLLHRIAPVKAQTGVLIFVSMLEHQAAVVADKGIASRVPNEYWEEACGMIVEGMKKGEHAEGVIRAIEAIGEELARHFPRQDDDVNELPDRPRAGE